MSTQFLRGASKVNGRWELKDRRRCVGGSVVRVTLVAGIWFLGACGTPTTHSPAQADSCDFDRVEEVLGATEDYNPPTPEVRKQLCEKAAPLIAEQEAREEALANPSRPRPAPEPSPIYVAEGIFGKEEANEGPPSDFTYENLWRGVVGKDNVQVLAGSEKKEPSHAVILLQVGDPLTGLYEGKLIDAPLPGPIRIIEAHNPRVTVLSESTGEQAVFDTEQGAWE